MKKDDDKNIIKKIINFIKKNLKKYFSLLFLVKLIIYY